MLISRLVGGRRRADGDAGFTLAELLVAMGIFSVVVAISLAGMRSMVSSTVRIYGTADARTEADRLYNRLDKIVPYAAAINTPGQSGGDWWVELRTDVAVGGQPAQCWQLRLQTGTDRVALRSWTPGDAASVTGWATLVTGATERAGGPAPFTMLPATSTVVRQRLVLALDVTRPQAPPHPLDTTYTARNTDDQTVTNNGGLVCQEVTRS